LSLRDYYFSLKINGPAKIIYINNQITIEVELFLRQAMYPPPSCGMVCEIGY